MMTRFRLVVVLLAAAAAVALFLKKRSSSAGDGDTRAGPPASEGTAPLDRIVLSTPDGEISNDPAGQWADDGGGGVGGSQAQR